MNTEMKEYIDAIARLNETIDSDEKFEFCRTYYDAKKKGRLTPNPKTYGYEPTGNEYALGLGVPEGFILYDFDLPPNDKFREYYKKTWGHTGTKPEGCGHLLFRCKTPHSSMTNDTNLTIFGSEVQLCRKRGRPVFTPGSRKIKDGGITHHWNKIEEVLDEPVDFRRERMMAKKFPSIPQNQTGATTTAGDIAQALGGKRIPSGWSAHCPAHDDKKPSLLIQEGKDGTPWPTCYAGCTRGEIFEALRNLGIWGGEPTPEDKKTYALKTWEESKTAENTLVETYLSSRGLNLPVPPSIRFHPNLKHRDGEHFPCMISLITRSDNEAPMAIHRTFLAQDGKKIAPVKPARMKLGAHRGGVVRLGEPAETLMIGNEIEKCLSVMQERNLPAWAYLSSSLRAVKLPPNVKEVILLNDYGSNWIKYNFEQRAAKQGFRLIVEEDEDIDPESIKVRKP